MKKIFVRFFALLVVIGILIWYLPRLDFDALATSLKAADLGLIGLGLAIIYGVWAIRSVLLWRIFKQRIGITYRLTFGVNMLGAMFDQMIPGRSGLFARWGVLSLRFKKSKGFIISALTASLIIEGVALLLIFLLAITWSSNLSQHSNAWVNAGAIVVVVGLFLGLIFSKTLERKIHRFKFSKWSPVEALFETADRMRRPATGFSWLALALANWFFQTVAIGVFASAFGISLDFSQRALLLTGINLAILVPIVPGNIGTIQLVITTILTQFGVASEAAFAFSIVYHLGQMIPVFSVGGPLSLILPMNRSTFEEPTN